MKTINYELAKKLYDTGVVIESEKSYGIKHTDEIGKVEIACGNLSRLDLCDTHYTNIFQIKYPAPNIEEVIEFLKKDISIGYSEIFSQYVLSHTLLDRDIFRDTLIEALEATLEYLFNNGYIYEQKRNRE